MYIVHKLLGNLLNYIRKWINELFEKIFKIHLITFLKL